MHKCLIIPLVISLAALSLFTVENAISGSQVLLREKALIKRAKKHVYGIIINRCIVFGCRRTARFYIPDAGSIFAVPCV